MSTSSIPAPSDAAIEDAASRRSSRRPLVTSLARRRSVSASGTSSRTTRSGIPRASRTSCNSVPSRTPSVRGARRGNAWSRRDRRAAFRRATPPPGGRHGRQGRRTTQGAGADIPRAVRLEPAEGTLALDSPRQSPSGLVAAGCTAKSAMSPGNVPRPAGSCFAYPRWLVISSARARSSTALVTWHNSPSGAARISRRPGPRPPLRAGNRGRTRRPPGRLCWQAAGRYR